jgi:hypothetical protein
MGELSVLNVAGGDIKITFDKNNVGESIRAKRMILDMQKRGYALLVEVERNGERAYERALGFDEKTGEYIIADFDPHIAETEDAFEEASQRYGKGLDNGPKIHQEQEVAEREKADPSTPPIPAKLQRGRRRRIDAGSAKAVGVARSAGG